MDLLSTSSTQSPPDSPKLPMAIATRIPPELLLDIFSIVSDSPHTDYKRYLERNWNLKGFALVHSAWRSSAKEVLQEEVYIGGTDEDMASDEEIERIPRLLIDSSVQGTKYLTIDGHLNELMAKTGYERWSQARYLKLFTGSRNDGTTWMSDFASFPNLHELYLDEINGDDNSLRFLSPDVNLRFPHLRRITFHCGITIHEFDDARDEHLAALLPITHKLFSPSNMPNLRHLALCGHGDDMTRRIILLAKILPQITTLALSGNRLDPAILFPKNRIPDNVSHLSLHTGYTNLHGLNGLDLKSLHVSTWTIKEEEMISRLIKVAKGEDPKIRSGEIVIYGQRRVVETRHKDFVGDLDLFKWREDRGLPPFEDFDGA